jgi:hypothetical protein
MQCALTRALHQNLLAAILPDRMACAVTVLMEGYLAVQSNLLNKTQYAWWRPTRAT